MLSCAKSLRRHNKDCFPSNNWIVTRILVGTMSHMSGNRQTRRVELKPGAITSELLAIRPNPTESARIGYYIVRTARNRVVPSTTR
jgi:hypothetical protein